MLLCCIDNHNLDQCLNSYDWFWTSLWKIAKLEGTHFYSKGKDGCSCWERYVKWVCHLLQCSAPYGKWYSRPFIAKSMALHDGTTLVKVLTIIFQAPTKENFIWRNNTSEFSLYFFPWTHFKANLCRYHTLTSWPNWKKSMKTYWRLV
jgi:hypothetical protein